MNERSSLQEALESNSINGKIRDPLHGSSVQSSAFVFLGLMAAAYLAGLGRGYGIFFAWLASRIIFLRLIPFGHQVWVVCVRPPCIHPQTSSVLWH